jgi:hypothetical protein
MFHTGSSLPDPSGVPESESNTSRVMRTLDHDDLAAKADALLALIGSWIELKG